MTPHAISTMNGRWVDISALDPKSVSIDDVALGLSRRARFGGFTRTFYSVAQHSWNVAMHLRAYAASPIVQLQGLLHDCQEAYMGDVPTPHKPLYHGFAELEEHVQATMFGALGVEWPVDSKVKSVDYLMLHAEASTLLTSPLPAWVKAARVSGMADLSPWTEVQARHKFLDFWYSLRKETA